MISKNYFRYIQTKLKYIRNGYYLCDINIDNKLVHSWTMHQEEVPYCKAQTHLKGFINP